MKLKGQRLKPEVIEFILDWLPAMDNRFSSQEWLVRGLILAKKPFDGKVLTELFDDPRSNFDLKWAIGNTIDAIKVLSIADWLKKTILGDYGKEKEMLVFGLWKYFPYTEAMQMAMGVFDRYPLHASNVFAKIGRQDDLDFLLRKYEGYQGQGKPQIRKGLKKLEAKLAGNKP